MVWIVTDAAADLPNYVVEQYGIRVIGGTVSFGEEVLATGPSLAASDFYARWQQSGHSPVVSDPTVDDIRAAYESILRERPTGEIISIHASSALSETVQRARVAAAAFDPARIQVVDSGSVSVGLALQVREAAEMARRRDVASIRAALAHLRAATHGFLVMESLDYLKRSGRLGTMDRMIGGLLAPKPILTLEEGKIRLHDQRRTRPEALEALSEAMIKSGWAHSGMRVGIAHAVCEEEAHTLASVVSAALKPEVLIVTEFGAGNGVLGGPGTIAGFWASPR